MNSTDKMMHKYQVDEVFYVIGKIIFLPVLLFGFWFADHGFAEYKKLFECVFWRSTGLPCPGCGGTRAFYYLFRGEVVQSFVLNPVVLYGVAAYLHFMLMTCYRKHIKKDLGKGIMIQYYLYGAAAVLLMQWAIKIMQAIFN